MKKEWYIVILLGVIILVGLYFLMFVKPSPVVAPTIETGLVITNIKANGEISSPVKIIGYVNGNGWSGFEGQVGTVKLLDNSGKEIISGVLKATTEWTTLPTNFETTLTFDSTETQPGTLVFYNENPSGMPEKDKHFSLPINIKVTE